MANRRTECLNKVLDTIFTHGGRDINIIEGKHIKLRFTSLSGKKQQYTMSATPSDGRAIKNMTSDVRRMARA